MLTGIFGADIVSYHLYKYDSDAETANQNLLRIKQRLLDGRIVKMNYLVEKKSRFVNSLARSVKEENASPAIILVRDRVKLLEDSYSLQMMGS